MIRWLIGLALLVNLGLFMWIQTRLVPQQSPAQKVTMPSDVQKILLLREMDQQQSTDAEFEPEQDGEIDVIKAPLAEPIEDTVQEVRAVEPVAMEEGGETKPKLICGRIGPYEEVSSAEDIRERLKDLNISLDIVKTTEPIKTGYWVLIPTLSGREEARQMVKDLKAAGVKDLWLINKGPMKNAISLGLYAGPSNAASHSRNINKKGFNSEVSPKMSEQPRYWLDYTAMDEQSLIDGLGELSKDLQNKKKACE